MKSLKDMSLEELAMQKAAWWKEGYDNKNIPNLFLIGRVLGTNLKQTYGPKLEFKYKDLRIYIDDYGHFMVVYHTKPGTTDERKVVDTTSKLYIPGEWTGRIRHLVNRAMKKKSTKLSAETEAKRQQLLLELTL